MILREAVVCKQEEMTVCIIHERRMSNPGVSDLSVDVDSHVGGRLISSCVVLKGIELGGTLGTSDQMNETIVSLISDVHYIEAVLIHDSLPSFRTNVCLSIHDASITENHGLLSTDLSKVTEAVFNVHHSPDKGSL